MARLSLRIDLGPGRRVGPGKMQLLDQIRAMGSISAAGRAMGMSYRRAWLLIDDLNGIFEEPVVTTKLGGPSGGGASLTPFGEALLANYRMMERMAAEALAEPLSMVADAMRREPSQS